jgi:AcrR family transcriptional regulator
VVQKRSDAVKNRAHVLSVARVMMQEGELTPSFNALAKRAGVGVGTVYRHFADHQALLAGLVERQFVDLEDLTTRARAESDPVVALGLLLRGVLALELDSPVIAQLLASPQRESREFAQQLAALEATGELILARGRKAKSIRPDVKAGDLRRLVCGLELAVRTGDKPAEAAARYVDIVLAGLRRAPSGTAARGVTRR